jgi:phage head maturation protease
MADPQLIYRAYSVVDVKAMNDEKRTIEGMATTPSPDRAGDIVVAEGVRSAADIPLFLHHDSRLVVGRTVLGQATRKGVPFRASLPFVTEAGALRDRIEEAWQSVKYQLITGVSIGFKPLWDKVEQLKDGGLKFLECEVLELSLVPVPMQAEAVITQFRSATAGDTARGALIEAVRSNHQALRRAALGARPVIRLDPAPAASGGKIPGASGAERRKGVIYLN